MNYPPTTLQQALTEKEQELLDEINYRNAVKDTVLNLTFLECEAKIIKLEREIQMMKKKIQEAKGRL